MPDTRYRRLSQYILHFNANGLSLRAADLGKIRIAGISMAYETLLTEVDGAVAVITLNRPDALNAFNNQLMDELTAALDRFDTDPEIGCIVITGSKKAFAAGADIKEMRELSYMEAYYNDFITRNWERAARTRKPLIAAVNGYALGGGCELAMRRRHATPAPVCWEIESHGNVSHRSDDGRRGG